MRKQAQFDLGIVRGKKLPPAARNEAFADVSAQLSADRNILQVRIARGKPAGRGNGLRLYDVCSRFVLGLTKLLEARRCMYSPACSAHGTP